MSTEAASPSASRWASAWPDALAFVGGLGLAWFGGWQTKDLVWSLWVSSLLVGYALIVWSIFSTPEAQLPPVELSVSAGEQELGSIMPVFGRLFLLAFFTVHFGGFHYVHSIFLNGFFPIAGTKASWPSLALFWQVIAGFWPFVLVTAVAERRSFRRGMVLAANGSALAAPYRNVVRLHLLIFFFAFAHFARLDNFAVYAVVYAVYFFPWRLLKREAGSDKQ